ncbi:MAG TPA: HAMP domain-containing sensor histidine kinase, partial [Planctomycetaceae bacterium]|nr:HAMP domain-containing sensor histidine kinase [Planctomycetaceae bacterium]
LVAAVVGMAGFSAWLSSSRQIALLQDRQREVAHVLEAATFPLTGPVLQQVSRLSGQQFIVWDAQSAGIAQSSFAEVPVGLAERIVGLPALQAGDLPVGTLTWNDERYEVRPIRQKGPANLLVLVLTPQQSLDVARWDAIWPILAVGAGLLVVLIPWMLTITRGWSQRIGRIQQAVARIANGEQAIAIGHDGRDDELAALVADIQTMSLQLQQLQRELLQTERERLVAQLAAGFAHQFRNGVAGASLALQLHRQRCGAADEKSLAVAQRQLTLLETEIRGMLSLAKRAEHPHESFSVAKLIDEAVELVSPAAEHQAIDLQRRLPAECGSVTGSREGLRAALVNLLQNAIDAAGPSGIVRIGARQDNGRLLISVTDNGPGPAIGVADRMAEAFVTTKPEGIGLGLTVVSTVAHDHGGRLDWRREGDWTVVELSLPDLCGESRTRYEPNSDR